MALSRGNHRIFPALGAGKLEDDENQLIQAPEGEEDFDILNDETFGGLGDAEYDWEDEHTRMAEKLEGSYLDTSLERNKTRDSGFVTLDRGYSSATQDEELEQSISRLMVDDGDGSAFNVNGQPIPGALRRSHLDELFGPNSPPAFLDLDSLTSPNKNIWGSPSGDSTFQKPVSNTLQVLFASAKQAAFREFPGAFQDAASKPVQAPHMPLPSEVPTLAEIEHNMMARENLKPRVLTAEELERQLRGEPLQLQESKPYFSMPAHIPPVGTAVAFRKQPSQGPHTPRMPIPESSPINIIRPHAKNLHSYPGQESPAKTGSSPSPSPSPSKYPAAMAPGLVAQSPRLITPFGPAAMYMANSIFGNAMTRPPPPAQMHVLPANVSSPFGSPSAVAITSRTPQGLPVLDHQSPPNRSRMIYPPPHLYSGLQMQQHHQSYIQQHHPGYFGERSQQQFELRGSMGHANQSSADYLDYENQRVQRQLSHSQRSLQESSIYDCADRESEDEYAGLMTKKEKEWIIKIQLIQLQTDNPYLDDYYYTCYTMKKKTAERDKQRGVHSDKMINEPELVLPNMIRLEPRIYTPAQFEGSLGRLTAASVHNPRQIIDVCRNVSPTNEDLTQKNVSKELRRYRQLLMDIEKGFNLILDVDDIEKKVLALPDENRLPLFEERLEKIQSVYDYFMQDDSLRNFLPTLSVRKGRKLLARLMPLLDKVQWLSVVTVLFSHLPKLIKKDQEEEGLQVLMTPLSRYLAQCDLECLVHFATILQKHPKQNEEGLSLLLHTSFGISLLCCLIKCGEDYFKNTSPVDMDNQLKTQWTQFIEEFIESLEMVPSEELAWPETCQPQVSDHVDRFINNKLIGSVEDKLAHFSKPRPQQQQGQVDSVQTCLPIS